MTDETNIASWNKWEKGTEPEQGKVYRIIVPFFYGPTEVEVGPDHSYPRSSWFERGVIMWREVAEEGN